MKTPKRQISFLERKEVEKIIAGIKPEGLRNLRDRALIEVLFSTGLRISEALSLSADEMIPLLDEKGTSEFPIIGKGGWQRVIYFSPKAKTAIAAYLPIRERNNRWWRLTPAGSWQSSKEKNEILGYISPECPILFPITSRCAQKMVIERARTAGITKRVTPHVFRHSLATDLLKQGVDIAFVSKFLGHRSLNNTMIYAHIVSPQLLEIHKKLYK